MKIGIGISSAGRSPLMAAAACAAAFTASAKLVSYDIGDYVQDGLVLHFDGIRNAGADKPHSGNAVQWANLGSKSGVVANRNSRQGGTNGWDDDATLGTSAWGEWEDDCFVFDWRTVWWIGGKGYSIDKFTLQFAVDVDRGDRGAGNQATQYLLFANGKDSNGNDAWKTLGVGYNGNASGYGNGMYATMNNWGYQSRPALLENRVRYFTEVQDATSCMVFSGTSTNDATTANCGKISGRTVDSPVTFDYMWLGANGKGWQAMTGKLYNFRLYDRVLSEEELVRNRMVDDARFFGRPPVTNVVVATSRMGLEGAEKSGAYQVDGSHSFTAPATAADSRGFEFACAGFTTETWDAAAQCWGEPVAHSGTSYDYSVSGGLVRLTWQWTAAKALYSASSYDLSDYVSGGLALHYDGIRNAGAAADHDSSATTWVNVAPGGGHDLAFAKRNTGDWDYGEWTDKGYDFRGHSYFTTGPVEIPARQTVQALVDANAENTVEGNKAAYFWYVPTFNRGSSLLLQKDTAEQAQTNTWIRYGTAGYGKHAYMSYKNPHDFSYVTATLGAGAATVFSGTEKRATAGNDGNGWAGWAQLSTAPTPFTAESLSLGGNTGTAWQKLVGTVKDFRLYDRILSDAELAANREVDEARFFGRLVETNVVVAVKDGFDFALSPAAGEYKVGGEWTFSASGGADTPTHFFLETWDEGSASWTGRTLVESLSYAYGPDSPAKVRITWAKAAPFVLVLR